MECIKIVLENEAVLCPSYVKETRLFCLVGYIFIKVLFRLFTTIAYLTNFMSFQIGASIATNSLMCFKFAC